MNVAIPARICAAAPAATGDAAQLAPAVAFVIEREVVRRIDEIDNGVGQPGDALGLSGAVEDCNPPWDSPEVGDRAAEDSAFLRTADPAGAFCGAGSRQCGRAWPRRPRS